MQFHKEAFTNYLHRFLSFFHWRQKLLKFPIQNTEVQKIHISYIWSSVQPKPGFGIRNQNQGPISVSEPKFFFRNRNFFFSNFSHFFLILGGIYNFRMGRFSGMEIFSTRGMKKFSYLKIKAHSEIVFLCVCVRLFFTDFLNC